MPPKTANNDLARRVRIAEEQIANMADTFSGFKRRLRQLCESDDDESEEEEARQQPRAKAAKTSATAKGKAPVVTKPPSLAKPPATKAKAQVKKAKPRAEVPRPRFPYLDPPPRITEPKAGRASTAGLAGEVDETQISEAPDDTMLGGREALAREMEQFEAEGGTKKKASKKSKKTKSK